MSQRASGYLRKVDEEYPTPPWCAAIIGDYLRQYGVLQIWEPAAGHPGLTEALRACGFAIVPSSDDFFEYTQPPLPVDAICTNPPYGINKRGGLASDFIRHALTFRVRVVAMLLPIDFDSARSRTDLFRDNEHFADKIVLLNRIKWFDGPASPSVNHAWFVWDRAHRGVPSIRYAERPSEWDRMWIKPLPLTAAERNPSRRPQEGPHGDG